MDNSTALKRLNHWSQQGRFVFTRADLAKIFHDDTPRALKAGLQRLVDEGILVRPARGIYVYTLHHGNTSHTAEHVARALRRGNYNYISLESALSEYGIISQIPVDRLTVMTTGRKGEYPTPFGTIEFTHTKRAPTDILPGTQDVGRPLKLATPAAAWRDLKRVGRNTHLVDQEALSNHV